MEDEFMNYDLSLLEKEFKKLSKSDNIDDMIKFDDLMHQFECESFEIYGEIINIAKENHVNNIYDIGCASGYQSEAFKQENINYIGIEGYFTGKGYWNDDIFKYIEKPYPFKIDSSENDIAISKLCIGWNCFKFEDNTYLKQLEALSRDFKTVILYTTEEFINIAHKYFNNITKCSNNYENLYLLKN